MGGGSNKTLLDLAGYPVLQYSLTAFFRAPQIELVVVVAPPAEHHFIKQIVKQLGEAKPTWVIAGGDTRLDSEKEALTCLYRGGRLPDDSVVLLHDAARPFISIELVSQLIGATDPNTGAVPVLGSPFQIFLRESGSDLLAPPADPMLAVQTPQAFPLPQLLDAYQSLPSETKDQVRDTAGVMRAFSTIKIRAIPGDPNNLKITYPVDLKRATQIARSWPKPL